MRHEHICILGGTGFVGSHIAARLVAEGRRVRILTRRPARHRELSVLPTVSMVAVDIHDEDALTNAMRGCDAVINLVGILNETSTQTFRTCHVELPRKVAQSCRALGIKRLLHMSSLKADAGNAPSLYLRSKGEGEAALRVHSANDVKFTIFQPSVIFGPGDSFINRFANLLRLPSPVFPLACAGARFQPVYIDDVVEAFVKSLDDSGTHGQRYTLCGPRVYTLEGIVRYVGEQLELRRVIIRLPDPLSRFQAGIMQWLPGKPFSVDNYRSLQVDSICTGPSGLAALGIKPTAMELIVPKYLAGDAHRGRLSMFRGS